MNLKATNGMTNLAHIISPLQCLAADNFPSIGIHLILSAIPFGMFISMQTIFSPPFSGTGVTTEEVFRMKIRHWTLKFLATPIAFFFRTIARASFFVWSFITAITRTILTIIGWVACKFDSTNEAFFNQKTVAPSIRIITLARTVFAIWSPWQWLKCFPAVFAKIFHADNIPRILSVVKISKEYCDIAVKRIEQERSQMKLSL